MGMLRAGRWTDDEQVIENGVYVRQLSVFDRRIDCRVVDATPNEPDRFHLIASHSCPWSHRVLLTRAVKGLDELIPVQIAHGPRPEGYSVNGGQVWAVPGTGKTIRHLHELYTLSDDAYTGRSTVPVLWDREDRQIVSNESTSIMRAFDSVRLPNAKLDFTLLPDALLPDIDAINKDIYYNLANGVYRALFAQRQNAYELAVRDVFDMLEKLDVILSTRRYLLGSVLTEADLRLFPTLMRFDSVYATQHRCSYRRLTDHPNVWAYARDLHSWKTIANAVVFDDMLKASYENEHHGIIPVAPAADWTEPHKRERLGPAHVALRDDTRVEVTPESCNVRGEK